jgi:hypothetical protein
MLSAVSSTTSIRSPWSSFSCASPLYPKTPTSLFLVQNPPLALILPFNSKHDVPPPPPPADELQWLAESDFVRRLVLLLHSPDADSQSHAHVALTGLIRSSQLRSPSVITRAGNPAFLIIHYRFSVHNMFVPPQSSIAQPWRTCSSASKPTASQHPPPASACLSSSSASLSPLPTPPPSFVHASAARPLPPPTIPLVVSRRAQVRGRDHQRGQQRPVR